MFMCPYCHSGLVWEEALISVKVASPASLCLLRLIFFKTALLRYNLHTIKFIYRDTCMYICVCVYMHTQFITYSSVIFSILVELYGRHHDRIRVSPPLQKDLWDPLRATFPSHLQPRNHAPVFRVYRFACSGCFLRMRLYSGGPAV